MARKTNFELVSKKDFDSIPFRQSEYIIKDKFKNKVILESRQVFSNDLIKVINKLAFDPKTTILYGTGIIKSLYYSSGDVDLMQGDTTKYKTESNFIKFLLKVLDRIDEDPKMRFLEVKSGIDTTQMIDIGYINTTQINKINSLGDSIIDYDYKAIIRDLKSQKMEDIIKYVKKKPTFEDWNNLYEQIRLKYTLRWTVEELRKGYKLGKFNNKITFKETLNQPAFTKIDTVTIVDDRVITADMTYYRSVYSEKTHSNSLLMNMFRMYFQGKYLKVIKRMMSFYRIFRPDQIDNIINLWKFLITYSNLIKVKAYSQDIPIYISETGFKYSVEIIKQLNNVVTFIGLIDNKIYSEMKQKELADKFRKLIDLVNKKEENKFNTLMISTLKDVDHFLNKKALEHLEQYKLLPFPPELIPSYVDSLPIKPEKRSEGKHYTPDEIKNILYPGNFPISNDFLNVQQIEPPAHIN